MMKFVNGFPQEELACMVDVMIGKDKKPHEVRIDAPDAVSMLENMVSTLNAAKVQAFKRPF